MERGTLRYWDNQHFLPQKERCFEELDFKMEGSTEQKVMAEGSGQPKGIPWWVTECQEKEGQF